MSASPAIAVDMTVAPAPTDPVAAGIENATVKLEAFANPNETLIVALVDKLNVIAKKVANPLTHNAIALPASGHTREELVRVFGFVGVTITDENVADMLPVLDDAKARIRKMLTEAAPATAAAPAKKAKAKATSVPDEAKAAAALEAKAEKERIKAEAKAKREAEKAERKAEREKKASERASAKVEPVLVPTFVIPGASASIAEERTKKLVVPENFYLEADPLTITKHRGHQIDPSRVQSYTPVMPNMALHAVSGNPYPTEADETVVTSDTYKSFVAISHFTFSKLRELGTLDGYPSVEITNEILEKASVPNTSGARSCIQDTLRDLVLYGLAEQYLAGRSRSFKLKA